MSSSASLLSECSWSHGRNTYNDTKTARTPRQTKQPTPPHSPASPTHEHCPRSIRNSRIRRLQPGHSQAAGVAESYRRAIHSSQNVPDLRGGVPPLVPVLLAELPTQGPSA